MRDRKGDDAVELYHGDCLDILPTLADGSVDAVITDPPYPEIDRAYGRMTEAAWHEMMRTVVSECRRILKPRGSAMFVLQSNSRKVGSMRPWLWEFIVWACREWNMVQDSYWWNFTAPPTVHAHRTCGLMRPSVKTCVWLGPLDCYRDQGAVLWLQSQASLAQCRSDRALRTLPSGQSMRRGRCVSAADDRGGTTPFNLIPFANSNSTDSAGSNGHGAGTPLPLCDWWVRYISPPGGVVCDPFSGTGTVGIAAIKHGRSFVGIEKMSEYHRIAQRRIEAAQAGQPLFAGMAR